MNSFGRAFRIQIFGESHGPGVGAVIDGCPPGLEISDEDFRADLQRRAAGKTGASKRIESDIPEILSGIFNGRSTGAPIAIFFKNSSARPADYEKLRNLPRPGHADFTAHYKYKGYNDYRGGGQFSGRLTLTLVAAGVLAKKIIGPTKIEAKLTEAGGTKDIDKAIEIAEKEKDSIGGIAECCVTGIKPGLGEPFFDSVESAISALLFSIPGIKGVEFGAGFESARLKGSENNDVIISREGRTATNNAGGINGGITNGNDIFFRVAAKPAPSIPGPQKTINLDTGKIEEIFVKGRHDACYALRLPPIVEACAAVALADFLLINDGRQAIQGNAFSLNKK